jgi:Ca-activated chloride channel family protein
LNFFAHPELLYCIPVVLSFLVFFYFRGKKLADFKLNQLVSSKFKNQSIPSFSKFRRIQKFCIFTLGTALILIGLAGPQWGHIKRSISPRGIDILIAVDLSKSMLARDIEPNRLERVKLSLSNLLYRVKGDRLGLIAFSGSSFLQCPLTLDHQAFSKSLDDLEVGLIPRSGTNLAQPIQEAVHSFSKEDTDKFLILISDGEDLEGEGLKQAKLAAKQGVKIFTIGIGSPEGAFIPTDAIGQPPQNFLTDRQGQKVITKFDRTTLEGIAKATNGQFLPIGPTGEGIDHVFTELQTFGQKKLREEFSTSLPINRYQIFILLGLVFLISESLTSDTKRKKAIKATSFILMMFCMGGCWKPENIELAEQAMENGDYLKAAESYSKQIEMVQEDEEIGLLSLNTGLAYLRGNNIDMAEKFLEKALEKSINSPSLQSKVLNALGNIYYSKTNSFLDRQDVNQARKAWEKSRSFYSDAISVDQHSMAEENLRLLEEQIEKRIDALVCKIQGIVWRDINGNGKPDENEPRLNSVVFWDRDSNGEHNESLEPFVNTDQDGQFAFEWISGNYPISLPVGSSLKEQNQSKDSVLLAVLPIPPPPLNVNNVKNHLINLNAPGTYTLLMPWRAAPLLKGKVWSDTNGNGRMDSLESGTNTATIFIDTNGNFIADENETSFKPNEEGIFSQPVPPGQYSVSISPDNPDANITCPIEKNKAYLTWVDFEQNSAALNFGLQQDSNSSNSSQSDESQQSDQSKSQNSENSEDNAHNQLQNSDEVNALYERLLQETESKSEPLQFGQAPPSDSASGRDY